MNYFIINSYTHIYDELRDPDDPTDRREGIVEEIE